MGLNSNSALALYRCTDKDVNRIIALAKSIWIPAFKEILSPDRLDYLFRFMYSPEKLSEHIQDKHQEFYFLLNEGKEVGYSHIVFNPNYMKLEKIYVHPAHQGRGCGLYLLQQMRDKSTRNQRLPIQLQVNRGNTKAVEFYLKFGFSIIGSEDFDVGGGHVMDDYIMIYHH